MVEVSSLAMFKGRLAEQVREKGIEGDGDRVEMQEWEETQVEHKRQHDGLNGLFLCWKCCMVQLQ